jgi:hypothetical protein
MMGRRRRDQGRLFYEFGLEDRIPENHLLRRINVFMTVALEDLHKELEPHYSLQSPRRALRAPEQRLELGDDEIASLSSCHGCGALSSAASLRVEGGAFSVGERGLRSC